MAYTGRFGRSDDFRREELIRIIEHSVENLTLQDFETFLQQIGHERDAHEICFDLWFFANHEGDRRLGDKSYKTYFNDVVLDQSKQELALAGITHSEAMQRMEEYMNHSPRWMLRGHSPAEMNQESV